MCFAVKCSTCGKSTWAGCGRHVASVYKQIQEGQHCLCREWPGVQPAVPQSTPLDSGIASKQPGSAVCGDGDKQKVSCCGTANKKDTIN
uniref:Uncharacterized protein n=1 Tax=Nelumbo nucifera TaxID=4432 RepID=A0A822Z367_NELNU|nr:TPA_asm: hypothetical protein HUJ06_013275 [Nelumbo nucifera]